jgi:glutamate/tyrosine decarboxylase-like PLP-dependent enzyme
MTIHNVSYVNRADDVREPSNWSPEWSRCGRALPTYAAIRELGRNGITDLVERCCKYAHQLAMRIGSLSGAELVWESQINQGLVRFLSAKPNATSDDHDMQTDAVISAIVQSGEAFFSGTTWRGNRCMRISVCNWQTNENDVNRAVTAVEQAILRTRRG